MFIKWNFVKAVHSRAVSQSYAMCETVNLLALWSQGSFSDVGLEVRYVELDLHEERMRYLTAKAVNVFLLLDSWIFKAALANMQK